MECAAGDREEVGEMENRAGFERDIGIMAEWATNGEPHNDIDLDNWVIEITHDYNISVLEVWYAFCHSMARRAENK